MLGSVLGSAAHLENWFSLDYSSTVRRPGGGEGGRRGGGAQYCPCLHLAWVTTTQWAETGSSHCLNMCGYVCRISWTESSRGVPDFSSISFSFLKTHTYLLEIKFLLKTICNMWNGHLKQWVDVKFGCLCATAAFKDLCKPMSPMIIYYIYQLTVFKRPFSIVLW